MVSFHEIKNNDQFQKVINAGLKYAKENKLVTFGVVPHSAETGYGYIKAEKPFKFSEIIGNKINRGYIRICCVDPTIYRQKNYRLVKVNEQT